MSSFRAWSVLVAAPLVTAICSSYGTDYVHGGTYCVDTRSNDFFSFGTAFWGCSVNDTQGGVDPILVDPNSDDYICSTIQTNPDDVNMISTCNVAGEEYRKSQMISGSYTAVIEGLDFAWARVFSIVAGPPVEVTSTPTISITVTSTPITTTTSTLTNTVSTTLPPSTTTVPATTNTHKTTLRPKPTTTTLTTTKTLTTTIFPPKITRTTTTKTITTSCRTATRRNDPPCTIHPPKASLAAAAYRVRRGNQPRNNKPRVPLPEQHIHIAGHELARRTPDLCTTTVLASTEVTSTTTSVAPPSTVVDTTVVERTETM